MSTDAYTQFKQAFLDQVVLKGYDADFIEGFFKRAEDEYSNWVNLINVTYAGDPELCKRAYAEAAYSLQARTPGEKQAEGELGPQLLGFLDNFGSGIGNLFGQQAGSGLGGMVAGGGGGMLIGLLLSQLFDIPLPAAMMLGALGGGALGHYAAGTPGGREKFFGVKPPGGTTPPPGADTAVTDAAGAASAGAGAPPPKPTPAPQPNPQAAAAVAGGQQVANTAATPGAQPPPAPAPAPGATPKPVVPPAAGAANTLPPPGGSVPGTPPPAVPGAAGANPVTPPKPPGQK